MSKQFKLVNAECIETMKRLPDNSIDLILTDPPYGTTACKWDSIIPLDKMWEQLKRIIKPNGAIVLTASQPFTSVLVSSNLKMFKYDWTWKKNISTGHLNSKKQPMRDKEDIVVFYKKQCIYNPQMTVGTPYKGRARAPASGPYGRHGSVRYDNEGLRYPKQVLNFKVVTKQGNLHPTQKPVALMEYLIKTYSNENDLVLDFTMGSGTTGVACLNTDRKFLGIELDEKYFEIAKKRIEEREVGKDSE